MISEKEKEIFVERVAKHGHLYSRCTPKVGLEQMLHIWNTNKQSLFKKFGNKLILSKEVEIDNTKQLRSEIESFLYNDWYHVFNQLYNFMVETEEGIKWETWHEIINAKAICENKYNGSAFTYKGKYFNSGIKWIKMIKTLLEMTNLLEPAVFEKLRLDHSQILNKKSKTSILYLSIHPLDFATMSDNSNTWSSCMSWAANGGYRLGTVEMMNSKYAIVAYLKSSSKEYQGWNSKTWRTLILANDDIIVSGVNYPYDDENLTELALSWVRELMGADNYEEKTVVSVDDVTRVSFYYENKERVAVHYKTGRYYNDFYYNACLAYLNKNRNIVNQTLVCHDQVNCLCCGRADVDADMNDDELICHNCIKEQNLMVECHGCGIPIPYELVEEYNCSYCEDCRPYNFRKEI